MGASPACPSSLVCLFFRLPNKVLDFDLGPQVTVTTRAHCSPCPQRPSSTCAFLSQTTQDLIVRNRTESDLSAWLQTNFLPEATSADIAQILELYPPDQTAGSPFNTGPQNELSAQYMRTAAIQGDMVFQAPRRYLMQAAMGKQPMWGFRALTCLDSFAQASLTSRFPVSTRFKALPQLPFLPYNKLHYLGSVSLGLGRTRFCAESKQSTVPWVRPVQRV